MLPRAALFLLLASGASAFSPRELPDRFNLPGGDQNDGLTVSFNTPLDELKDLILSTATTVQRMDASFRWSHNTKEGAPDLGDRLDGALEMMETLLADAKADPLFRRALVCELFGATAATIRDAVPFHPKDAVLRARWKRVTSVRDRGLKDRDPKLAEYFERYLPVRGGTPPWQKERKTSLALADKVVAARPDLRQTMADAVKMTLSIEDSQLQVNERLQKDVKGRKMKGCFARVCEYRLYTAWGNLFRRVVKEMTAPDGKKAFGIVVEPVKLGWPEYD